MADDKRRRRNAVTVKMDIIDAVGTVLKKYGFLKLGISIVADEAKVDKTVIYRNFGDFDKVLEAYIEKQDFWLLALKEHGEKEIQNKRGFMKQLLTEQFDAIYKSKELQEILVWGLSERKGYVSTIALKREILSQGINDQYQPLLNKIGLNFNAFSALLVTGVYYVILNKDQSTICDIDINKKAEKEEFLKLMYWLIDLVFDKIENINEIERVAIKAYENGINKETIVEITNLSIERINQLISD